MIPKVPVPQRGPLRSCGPTVITAAAISCGGSISSAHCVKPKYDAPIVPNDPVNQGCVAQPRDGVGAVGDLVDEGTESPPDP